MKVAVLGGTGVVGRKAVAALGAQGHDAVPLARSTGVNVVTGDGLAEALVGVDAVIDTTNVSTMRRREAESFFEAATTNLISTSERAGVAHIVALSIVGIERVRFGYYQGKQRQEQILGTSPVPVSILRATQFHEFAGQFLDRTKGPVVLVPKWRVQPVAASEVGSILAGLATGDPVPMSELAGPRAESMASMARAVIAARGEKRRVWEVRLPGATGRALAEGGNIPAGEALHGTQTFAEWLQEQQRTNTL